MTPCLHRIKQVCSSWRDNRHTHRTTTVPFAHAPRFKKKINSSSLEHIPRVLHLQCIYLHRDTYNSSLRVLVDDLLCIGRANKNTVLGHSWAFEAQ